MSPATECYTGIPIPVDCPWHFPRVMSEPSEAH